MPFRTVAAFVLLFVPTLLLSGCFGGELPPLPEGEQVVQGVLTRAQLSLVRRGSHLLRRGDTEDFYVESTAVNLRSFEGQSISLKGTFERNTDPDEKPVFVVTEVMEAEDRWKDWNFPGLGVSMRTPLSWESVYEDGVASFHQRESASGVILRIMRDAGSVPDGGVPLVIGTVDAVRFTTDAGGERIFVHHNDRVIRFDFTPPVTQDLATLREEWLTALRSVSFASAPKTTATGTSVSSSGTPLSGTGAGMPCGGPAGILCPSGYYCQITDPADNVGKCRAR